MDPERVGVFIDYQNTYCGARDAFHDKYSHFVEGQIDPLRLGELLASRGKTPRELCGVHVYRGVPVGSRDPRGNSAARKQITAWRASDPRVEVITRPLRYPPGAKPEEKGIDVAVAIGLVMHLLLHRIYDVGILVSADTDLKPALEAVARLGGNPSPRTEVAAWAPGNKHARRLSIPNRNIWCHYMDKVRIPTIMNAQSDAS